MLWGMAAVNTTSESPDAKGVARAERKEGMTALVPENVYLYIKLKRNESGVPGHPADV